SADQGTYCLYSMGPSDIFVVSAGESALPQWPQQQYVAKATSAAHEVAQIQTMAAGAKYMAWPKHQPAVHVPHFDEGMYKSVNLNVSPSEISNGLDLPLTDMNTLRFFFNLGVQQARAILLSQHLATTRQQLLPASAAAPATNIPSSLQHPLLPMMQPQKHQTTPAAAPVVQQHLSTPSTARLGAAQQAKITAANHVLIAQQAGNSRLQQRTIPIIPHHPAISPASGMAMPTGNLQNSSHGTSTTGNLPMVPIIAKSTPDIIIIHPTPQTSVSTNVSGFIPLTPKQQAAIDRKHQELAASSTSPSGSVSPSGNNNRPSQPGTDERLAIEKNGESPPLGPMLMFSYLNSCIGKTNKSPPLKRVRESSVGSKEMPKVDFSSRPEAIANGTLSHEVSADFTQLASEPAGTFPSSSFTSSKRCSNDDDVTASSNEKRLRIDGEDSPRSPLL
ncbi:hypothetical protein PENTCL1PPCAC_15944, partial [Pristionchus entomophagus]